MKYLLDTHVLLWWLGGDTRLTPAIRNMINDGSNEILVSAATIWEIGIKTALGKLRSPDDLLAVLGQNNIAVLPIAAQHAYAVRALPPLHGDPFDRMLVVQAQFEKATIITHDSNVSAYGGWASFLRI